jgi:hypothetical protein
MEKLKNIKNLKSLNRLLVIIPFKVEFLLK